MAAVSQRVAKGITRLSGGVCNFYAIEEGGKYTLVDAGAPKDWDLLARLVDDLNAVEAIVVTHAHSDHTGFAERARREAGARVFIHDRDAALAKGGKAPKTSGSTTRYLLRAELWRTVFSLMPRGGVKIVPIAELFTFADGEVLDVPGKPRVLFAPGHTPGSSGLLLEDRRVLFTGDSLVMRNPMTGRTGPQITADSFNTDSEEALRSLDVFARQSADLVLTGHGEPFEGDPSEAVELAKAAGRS